MKLQIAIDGKTYEVEVDFEEEQDPRILGGYIPPYAPLSRVTLPTPVAAPPPAPHPRGGNGSSGTAEEKICRSPMAGIVIKLNAQEGQEIQENDLLMVLEAMKMETNITAPVSGKVKAINVQPGDAVQVSQALVEFE